MAILKFQTIKPKNTAKTQNQQGYSVTYISQINSLLIYGTLAASDIYLYSLTNKQWNLIKTSGKKPSFRRFYAHYYHKTLKALIIHGGQIIQKLKKLKSSDQFYILFIQNWQWRKIFLPETPNSRQFHQIYQSDKCDIFTYGGFSQPYDTILNDLWSFRNIQKLNSKSNKHQVHGCQAKLIQTKGQSPSIYGYAIKMLDQKVLFFGGQSKVEKKRLDVYSLCLRTYGWQKVDIFNKVCPQLVCFNVYESGIDSDKLYIMGGMISGSNKGNEKSYSLSLKQMQVVQQQKSKLPENLYHTCCITQNPLCISGIQKNQMNEQLKVYILYERQPSSPFSKHFQTDQIQDSKQQTSIEQYLKAIKHQQILSQQLIKKNMILEQLLRQIHVYISSLYSKYMQDEFNVQNQQIQTEKMNNIKYCQDLKRQYMQNAVQLEQTLKVIKKLRSELGLIHQDFQRCIQTQMDEQQN